MPCRGQGILPAVVRQPLHLALDDLAPAAEVMDLPENLLLPRPAGVWAERKIPVGFFGPILGRFACLTLPHLLAYYRCYYRALLVRLGVRLGGPLYGCPGLG